MADKESSSYRFTNEPASIENEMTDAPGPEQNQLLAAILENATPRDFPNLKLVELKLGDVVYESGQPIDFVYFPTNCIISLLYVMVNGAAAEIAVVGNDGMVGVAVVMGGDSTPNRAT